MGTFFIGFQYKIASFKCTVHPILYRFSVENVTEKNLLIFNRKICIDFQYKMAISKVQQNQQKNVFENPYVKSKGKSYLTFRRHKSCDFDSENLCNLDDENRLDFQQKMKWSKTH